MHIKQSIEAARYLGLDPYKHMAAVSLGISYEDVTDEQRAEQKQKLYFYIYSQYAEEEVLHD